MRTEPDSAKLKRAPSCFLDAMHQLAQQRVILEYIWSVFGWIDLLDGKGHRKSSQGPLCTRLRRLEGESHLIPLNTKVFYARVRQEITDVFP